MLEDPLASLSFIAGPAILTNACAILQNGATTRYNLAVLQWREFQASLADRDGRVSLQYAAPERAVALAGRRVRIQLSALALLNMAVGLFATTTVLGLAGAVMVQTGILPAGLVALAMSAFGFAGLLVLLAATATFFFEGACGGALMRLHRSPEAPLVIFPGRRAAAS